MTHTEEAMRQRVAAVHVTGRSHLAEIERLVDEKGAVAANDWIAEHLTEQMVRYLLILVLTDD